MAANTKGVWLCCEYAIAQMLKQEALENGSRGIRNAISFAACESSIQSSGGITGTGTGPSSPTPTSTASRPAQTIPAGCSPAHSDGAL